MEVQVVDNFLEEYHIDFLLSEIEHPSYLWRYVRNISNGADDDTPWCHGFESRLFDVDHNLTFSSTSKIFCPIFLKIYQGFGLPPSNLMKARLDMTVRSPERTIHLPHTDYEYKGNIPHYAGILYMNDSDGDTVIYNEIERSDNYSIQKIISPKKNRLVLFNGIYYHTGHSPSHHNNRILLNFDYSSHNIDINPSDQYNKFTQMNLSNGSN
tara:strand:+ start:612 stop:1244 length:633 start_codon:yes stop_codon:yes gene_type:complete